MKKNFKKIISLVLTVLMLVGTFSAIIPMTASAAGETQELQLNADNYINGYNYRFIVKNTDGKYAKIEDGKLKFFLSQGDVFYISNLTVKDATSSYTFEGMVSAKDDMYIQIGNGISTTTMMYGSGFGGYNWKGYVWKWNDAGNSVSNDTWTYNSAANDTDAVNNGGTKSEGIRKDARWDKNEFLSVKTTFSGDNLVPTTYFYEKYESLSGVGNSDMYLKWAHSSNVGTCSGKSFGIIVKETNGGEVSIDKITATNMNETDSYVEHFGDGETINLQLNADNYINGYNYRFITSNTEGKYAKIEDGKLKFKLSQGDVFYISNLTVKDATSSYTFEGMTSSKNDTFFQILNGVSTTTQMYGSGFGSYNWKGYTWKWNTANSISNSSWTYNTAAHDTDAVNNGGTKSQGSSKDAAWASGEILSIRTNFSGDNLVPTTHFYERYASLSGYGNSDMYLKWAYSSNVGTCAGKSFGMTVTSADAEVSIERITATNMNETDSYVENFNKVASITNAEVNLTLGGDIGFNFSFNAAAGVPAGAEVVVTKAGEVVYTQAVVSGYNEVTAPVAAKEMTDEVNFSIVSGDEVFAGHTYTYTVAEYAEELLANDEYAEWADLINAMLTYGAAAQVYFDYNTDALAAELGEVTGDYSDMVDASYTGDITVYELFASLELESDTAIKVYIKPVNGEAPVVTVMGEEMVVGENGDGFYVVTIDDIAAEDIASQLVIIINGDVSISYSALNYAYKLATTSENADAVVLANAFSIYAKEAALKN
ncbi:MAG: hypothetical protein J6U86_04650 [Clostridia bacterium]|nr:hypothetical protein [Clostridia bacterium]